MRSHVRPIRATTTTFLYSSRLEKSLVILERNTSLVKTKVNILKKSP